MYIYIYIDEHHVAALHVGEDHDELVGCDPCFGERARLGPRQVARHAHHRGGGYGYVVGVATARQQRDDAVARRESADARAAGNHLTDRLGVGTRAHGEKIAYWGKTGEQLARPRACIGCSRATPVLRTPAQEPRLCQAEAWRSPSAASYPGGLWRSYARGSAPLPVQAPVLASRLGLTCRPAPRRPSSSAEPAASYAGSGASAR